MQRKTQNICRTQQLIAYKINQAFSSPRHRSSLSRHHKGMISRKKRKKFSSNNLTLISSDLQRLSFTLDSWLNTNKNHPTVLNWSNTNIQFTHEMNTKIVSITKVKKNWANDLCIETIFLLTRILKHCFVYKHFSSRTSEKWIVCFTSCSLSTTQTLNLKLKLPPSGFPGKFGP